MISQADSPASARALPSDNTPSAMPSSKRGSRGRSSRTATSRGSDVGMMDIFCSGHLDDVITDSDDLLAVPDDYHRVTGARPFDNGLQHSSFGRGIQVSGGLVEQQYRRRRPERTGQAEALPLTQRQPDSTASDDGPHTVGQLCQDFIKPCCRAGGFSIGENSEQSQVLGNGPGDEHRALRQPGNLPPPRGRFEVGEVDSGHGDCGRTWPW